MVKNMIKKYKFLLLTEILSVILSVFLLTGCTEKGEKTEMSITELIDLTPSNIVQIKLSQGGGPQTIIENPDQIKEICSFISSAFTLENQYKELKFSDITWVGGFGDYFLITYADNAKAHIQLLDGIQISGRTKEGEITDRWRIYPLVNFSQQEQLKEIISMTPAG